MLKYIHISVDFDWIPGSDQNIPQLYELFELYGVKANLFFTGAFAKAYPNVLKQAVALGHEIGSHGLNHGVDGQERFGASVSFATQKALIKSSTDIISQITGKQVRCFRAPYLSISKNTLKVLAELDYQIDSSLPSRRFDFGFGSIGSLKYFAKPPKPHIISVGGHRLLEIPPSARIIPLNMRMLRCFPNALSRNFTFFISATCKPLVFYMHPAEVTDIQDMQIPNGINPGFYKNCGTKHFHTLELFLKYLKHKDIHFKPMTYTLQKSQALPISVNIV